MSSDAAEFIALAEAVADGHEVDWPSAVGSSDDQAIVEQLHVLARIADAARAETPVWGGLEIRSEIGRGTFGTVYRAWYTKLECEVALKLLRGNHARIKEACLLAQVRHPNVITVYGADSLDGRAGIWMEFITGHTLKDLLERNGPFGPNETALIGRDLCRALAAVHHKGFLHGDVKAQNVMREAGGRTVLMDFGAGEAIAEQDVDGRTVLAGSPAYLAPEVLAGAHPSARSDIYSLGVLLYHMVSGVFPVAGASLEGLRQAHASGQRQLLRDVRPTLPSALVHAVDCATAAHPNDRPATAGELELLLERAMDLRQTSIVPVTAAETAVPRPSRAVHPIFRRPGSLAAMVALALTLAATGWLAWGRTTVTPRTSPRMAVNTITVAPFEIETGGTSWKAIATAMARDIADDLEAPGLTVKGRTNPLNAVGGDVTAQAIVLGAEAVVRGSLTADRDQLSVDVSVVRVKSRQTLWRHTYRVPVSQAASLPHSISAEIATALGFDPSRARTAESRNISINVYDHYARGRQLAEQRQPATLQLGIQQFEEAIRIQPNYAPAWAGLADSWIALGVPAFGTLRPFEARGRAREAALKALDLDPSLAEAQTTLAFLSYFYDWNWPAADDRFQRALRLNPSYAQAHHWYADYLNAMGRFPEATEQITIARALEPLSVLYQRDVAWHLFFQRRYDDAVAQLRRTLDMDPTYAPAISLLGRALVQTGDYEAGIAELRRLDPANPANAAMLGYAHAAAGHRAEAETWLSRVRTQAATQYVSPYSIALVEAALGNHQAALRALTTAFDEQDSTIVNLRVDPRWDTLRKESQFQQLITRLDFPNPSSPSQER